MKAKIGTLEGADKREGIHRRMIGRVHGHAKKIAQHLVALPGKFLAEQLYEVERIESQGTIPSDNPVILSRLYRRHRENYVALSPGVSGRLSCSTYRNIAFYGKPTAGRIGHFSRLVGFNSNIQIIYGNEICISDRLIAGQR